MGISSLISQDKKGSPLSDYRRFKTPYFRISVGYEGKTPVELPMQIQRLVKKIEIAEFFDGCHFDTVNITFVEGSREPYSKQEGGDLVSSYGTETGAGGALANHTGVLSDLVFKDLGGDTIGISSLGVMEVTSEIGSLLPETSTGLDQVGNLLDSNTEFDYKETSTLDKAPKFVFNEKNLIEIKWGYAENETDWRVVRAKIKVVRTDFPDNEHPTTTIIATQTGAFCDQLTPVNAINIKTDNSLSIPIPIPDFPAINESEDFSTRDAVEYIAKQTGSKVIISEEFDGDKLDAGYFKTIAAGQSPNQFLQELARRHHAHYKWIINPLNGIDTIVFIKANEWEKASKIDPKLMTYKGPGSILKSVSIKVDASGIVEDTCVGINDEGKFVKVTSKQGNKNVVMFEGQELTSVKPIGKNDSAAARGFHKLAGQKTSGTVRYDPESNQISNFKTKTESRSACQNKRNVVLEFVTIGYTKLHPRSCSFLGLGTRYSGTYYIQSVSHIIDNNGYTCRGMAMGHGLSAGGVEPQDITKGENKTEEVDVQIFEQASSTLDSVSDLASTSISNKASAEYEKMIGIA